MTRKIRVLQLIDTVGNAGAETLQRTFAEGLDRTQFDLHVCGLRPSPHSVTIPALRALGIPVIELNQRASYDLAALLALVRYIRRERIDIIHTHLQAADIMGRLAGFLTRRPVVSTLHSNRADLDSEPLRRQWLERWTAHLWCYQLVVVSELLRNEVADWFGLPPERVIAIPNGVDTARFQRGVEFDRQTVKQALVGSTGLLVTNVARLVPEKAQHTLIEAARLVVTSRPDARFALVGDGPRRAELEAQVAARSLHDHVVFAGFRENVPDILAASDVFVLSSSFEGMPVSLLEAMSAGCPVVATAVGGVREVVQSGVNGMVVPPDDPAALATAILGYLNDPARAQQIAATGRQWVEQKYRMRAWAQKWEDLYRQALGIPGDASP